MLMVEVGGEVGREMKERRRKWGEASFYRPRAFLFGIS